jgi:hypothetical protein
MNVIDVGQVLHSTSDASHHCQKLQNLKFAVISLLIGQPTKERKKTPLISFNSNVTRVKPNQK